MARRSRPATLGLASVTAVLDSSVIIAILRNEIGADQAQRLATGAAMSAVNVGELVTKCVEQNYPEDAALAILAACDVDIIDFRLEQAILAGQLRKIAPKGVLSLGDRACLATAILKGATAVTADKIWTKFDLGCEVALIR